MKQIKNTLSYILLTQILVLAACNSNSEVKTKKSIVLTIDTVTVPTTNYDKICFRLDSSNYPKINGMEDVPFQETVNNIFQKNFTSFVDSAKLYCDCSGGERTKEMPPYASSDFEVLYNKNDIISILQSNIQLPGGGGNAWMPSFTLTTVDLQKKIIMNSQQFNLSEKDIKEINAQIVKYFDGVYPKERGTMNYPLLDADNFKNAKFGIKSDSVSLVTEACPGAHYTHSIYVVPIKKW